MEKISGILPERPRLKSDFDTSLTPVRPGAPAFGRAEGSTEIRDRVSLSSMKNAGAPELQNYRNAKEAKNVKIVDELSRKFFMTKPSSPSESQEAEATASEVMASEAKPPSSMSRKPITSETIASESIIPTDTVPISTVPTSKAAESRISEPMASPSFLEENSLDSYA